MKSFSWCFAGSIADACAMRDVPYNRHVEPNWAILARKFRAHHRREGRFGTPTPRERRPAPDTPRAVSRDDVRPDGARVIST
jgi:hypothetical protein